MNFIFYLFFFVYQKHDFLRRKQDYVPILDWMNRSGKTNSLLSISDFGWDEFLGIIDEFSWGLKLTIIEVSKQKERVGGEEGLEFVFGEGGGEDDQKWGLEEEEAGGGGDSFMFFYSKLFFFFGPFGVQIRYFFSLSYDTCHALIGQCDTISKKEWSGQKWYVSDTIVSV